MPTASLTFSSSTRNSVTFTYGGTGWYIPEDGAESSISWGSWSSGDTSQTRTGTSKQTIYNSGCTTNWSWKFSGGNGGSSTSKEGTKTISGFNAGAKGTVSGTLSATRTSRIATRTYKQTRTRTKDTIKGEDGSEKVEYGPWETGEASLSSTSYASGSDKSLGTASDSFTFYTRPAEFTWSTVPQIDGFIEDSISATKWNELMDKAAQKKSWEEQSSHSSEGQQYHVSKGDFITAAIYNNGASLCGVSTRVTADKTLICASYFTALSNAVNSG